MRVQINSDDSVRIPEELANQVVATVEGALARFSDQITRIEVHLGDTNARKGGSKDKRCALEARLAGLRPIAVSHHAGTFEHALSGAAGKMQRALDSTLGKMRPH
jgi:hypothetical protein